jgi:hypothetical protein
MKTYIYRLIQDPNGATGEKVSQVLASVELEVVPRGIYVIDGIKWQLTGQPVFFIRTSERNGDKLEYVELYVTKYEDSDNI